MSAPPPTEEQEAERELAREREQARLAALGGYPVTWDAADVHEAAADLDASLDEVQRRIAAIAAGTGE